MLITNVPFDCINQAAIHYHVPAKLILSIIEAEGGKVGQLVKNKNGTYDLGVMQINSVHLPELKKHNISQNDIRFDTCKNIYVGAWLLSKKIAESNDLLQGVGNYHSKTPSLNKNYYDKIRLNFTKLSIITS